MLLKIFPKYISTFFSGVKRHCWGKLYLAVWKGFETNSAKLLTALQPFLLLESSPSGLMRQLGFQTLTTLSKVSLPSLDRGLLSYPVDKTKARSPSSAFTFPPSASRLHLHPGLTPPSSVFGIIFSNLPSGYPSHCPFSGSFIPSLPYPLTCP